MGDRRKKRDLHALDENGMVLCNPRDREAAHRAEAEGIATRRFEAVTCRKCQERMTKEQRRRSGPDGAPRCGPGAASGLPARFDLPGRAGPADAGGAVGLPDDQGEHHHQAGPDRPVEEPAARGTDTAGPPDLPCIRGTIGNRPCRRPSP